MMSDGKKAVALTVLLALICSLCLQTYIYTRTPLSLLATCSTGVSLVYVVYCLVKQTPRD